MTRSRPSVASRLGVNPATALLEVAGGQSPQHLVNEFAAKIAHGDNEKMLLAGSEAISTIRSLVKSEDKPDFSDDPDGDVVDRGFGLQGLVTHHQMVHGLMDAPCPFGSWQDSHGRCHRWSWMLSPRQR